MPPKKLSEEEKLQQRQRISAINDAVNGFELSTLEMSNRDRLKALAKIASSLGYELIPRGRKQDLPAQFSVSTLKEIFQSGPGNPPQQKSVEKKQKSKKPNNVVHGLGHAYRSSPIGQALEAKKTEIRKKYTSLWSELEAKHPKSSKEEIEEIAHKSDLYAQKLDIERQIKSYKAQLCLENPGLKKDPPKKKKKTSSPAETQE